jgi:hypothetical protein
VAVLLRLPGLASPARPDEAGYLLVAAQARPGGPFLYGDLWVDRPPLLVAFFRLADALGGLLAARGLALVAVVVLVLAAADAGRTLGGARGATWAAAVAAALSATPLLGATALNGELLGAPFVMLACALGPARPAAPDGRRDGGTARRRPARSARSPCSSSRTSPTPSCCSRHPRRPRPARELGVRRGVQLLAAVVAGAAVPLLVTLVWAAAWGAGPGVLVETVLGFRLASAGVLDDHTAAPLRRAVLLGGAAVAAGIVPVLSLLAVARWRGAARRAETAGIAAMTVTALVSMALGGSFWRHYLLQLVPATALAAAVLSTVAGRTRRLGAGAAALVAVSAVTSVVWTAPRPWAQDCRTDGEAQQAVSDWLRARVRPSDTAVTLYGVSNVLLGTGAARPTRTCGAWPSARSTRGWTTCSPRCPVRTARPGSSAPSRCAPGGSTPSDGSSATCGPTTARWPTSAAPRSCSATGWCGPRWVPDERRALPCEQRRWPRAG